MPSTNVTVNSKAVANLKKVLAAKLRAGCGEAVSVVREHTPIDTQRLFSSTRASMPVIKADVIECDIIAGGVEMFGVTRERDTKKEVDYAIYVEMREPYIRPNLDQIEQAILSQLQ